MGQDHVDILLHLQDETVHPVEQRTNSVLASREHLIAEQVSLVVVVVEVTGDYWKPFHFLLEDAGFEVMLVKARHLRIWPGRQTQVSDVARLTQLGAHGLVRGSFVPSEPSRQPRDLTRTRTTMTEERAKEILPACITAGSLPDMAR